MWGHFILSNLTDQLRGNFHTVEFLDLLRDVSLAHSTGIQSQNFLFHPFCVPVVLPDDFRFIVPLPVTGHLDLNLAELGLDRLL